MLHELLRLLGRIRRTVEEGLTVDCASLLLLLLQLSGDHLRVAQSFMHLVRRTILIGLETTRVQISKSTPLVEIVVKIALVALFCETVLATDFLANFGLRRIASV